MVRATIAALLISILAASGQDNVTLTVASSREAFASFAKAFARPTKLTGQIPRWETGICPVVVGQAPASTGFVTARMKAIAVAAGAPVNASTSCTANIEIVFTTAPQELLDNIRKHDPDYLGYAESNALREELATVTRPIQAWYATETVDLDGMRRVDSARRLGTGSTMSNFTAIGIMGNRDPIYLPDASYARVTGNRIKEGTRSGFHHIIITVDTKKLAGQDFVRLADYITMLALTQLDSLDTCQKLPSVVNMMAPDCDHRVEGMTAVDLAYLTGLYKMGADKSLVFQQSDIVDGMAETIGRQGLVAARGKQ